MQELSHLKASSAKYINHLSKLLAATKELEEKQDRIMYSQYSDRIYNKDWLNIEYESGLLGKRCRDIM